MLLCSKCWGGVVFHRDSPRLGGGETVVGYQGGLLQTQLNQHLCHHHHHHPAHTAFLFMCRLL
jgi:hypothetical protein